MRKFLIALTLLALFPTASAATSRWVDWPAVGQVVRLPVIPYPNWKPGHRGIDLRVDVGAAVLSPVNGTVVWSGVINQVPSITIRDAHGYRHSLLPVTSTLSAGDEVMRGGSIGTTVASEHCKTPCLHWGMKYLRRYVDPRWFAPPLIFRLPHARG